MNPNLLKKDKYFKINQRFADFYNEYKKWIKEFNKSIIVQKDILDLDIKVNNKSIVLENSKEIASGILEKNMNNFALIMCKEKNHISPEYFTFKDSLFLKYDDKKFRFKSGNIIMSESFIGKYKFSYLVKLDDLFNIKNAHRLEEKFRNSHISKIDEIILGRIDVEEMPFNEINMSNLDKHQQTAFSAAVSKNIATVIKGPPGTGKTHLASAIIGHFIGKEKIIFASAIHSSLDSLIEKNNRNELKGIKTWRSSFGKNPVFPNEYEQDPNKADLIVTTLASQRINDYIKDEEAILIVDEASSVNLFNVLSKTQLAKKIIIIGDNNQFHPIVPELFTETVHKFHHEDEYNTSFMKSLFERLYLKDGLVFELHNNYRSCKEIVGIVNAFYGNSLNSMNKSHQDYISLKSFENKQQLINGLKIFAKKNRDKNIIYTTHYKSKKNEYNGIFKKNELKGRFFTSSSIQGLEADEVVLVLDVTKPNDYQLDYRALNVVLSRAKKRINIFYINGSLDNYLIDSKKSGITHPINGSDLTLKELLSR